MAGFEVTLNGRFWVTPKAERKHGNGKEAARYDAWMGFKGMVVIHSVNEDGAKAMKTYLRQARVAPFREV